MVGTEIRCGWGEMVGRERDRDLERVNEEEGGAVDVAMEKS